MTRAFSGRPLADVTVDAAVRGELEADDVRIHPDTLREQAAVAEAADDERLGANLRRAAELTALADEDLLRIYGALRPGRASAEELAAVREELLERGATRCAALVEEAIASYRRRGLTR
ncbi:MAG: propanediol utilization protein [Actinobacteria bacterium]|nr:propanediol utilization protein [Actinomycetota bacterium]